MRGKNPIIALCGGLLLAAFLAGCSNPATDKPEAQVRDPVDTADTDIQGRRFVLAEGSSIGFAGSKITRSHNGGFNSFTGEITLVDGRPEASRVTVEIDTTSLWADNERLTGHLKSADFFDVASHPRATFESTAIEPAESGYRVTGNLDLHGVRRSITFPATIEVADDEIRAMAEFFIKRFDFDISYKGAADDLIRDEVVIKLQLVAVPPQAAPADS